MSGFPLSGMMGGNYVADDLESLGLIQRAGNTYFASEQGRNMIGYLHSQRIETSSPPGTDESLFLVGKPRDPLFYAGVLSTLSKMDSVLLVDPFLAVADLNVIAQVGTVSRVLTGPRPVIDRGEPRNDKDERLLGLRFSAGISPQMDVRTSTAIHDRYALPASGTHYALAYRSRTVFYTPEVLCRPKDLMHDIDHWQIKVGICADEHLRSVDAAAATAKQRDVTRLVELLIIDEAERLTPTALEKLRDQHDRTHLAMILIGMPGIDQRFRHYPQLYSRLGFSHRYRALGRDELLFVLDRHWKRLGRTLDPDDFTDAQAIAAIERITRGNFRLLERLFPQIARVLKINQLETITDDVIEAAASILVIGN